jgi:hypothetical protein
MPPSRAVSKLGNCIHEESWSRNHRPDDHAFRYATSLVPLERLLVSRDAIYAAACELITVISLRLQARWMQSQGWAAEEPHADAHE